MSGPGSGVDGLRSAAADAFRHPDFTDVSWAGVFGSFARGDQHADSDVDLVVLQRPRDGADPPPPPPPPDRQFLEDVLPEAWGRPVDIIYVEEGQTALRGYVQLEALLTSRTIFMRDGEAPREVARLRKLSGEVLQEGSRRFRGVVEHIQALQSRVAGGSLQAFLETPGEESRSLAAEVYSILDDLDIKPRWHPMHEAFWYLALEDASALRAKLHSCLPLPGERQYMEGELRVLWEVLTSSDKDSLGRLSRMITKFVLPVIDETQERSRQLEDISTYTSVS